MSDERYRDDIQSIRSLMEQSTRFLSLSGWSGIMAGVYALTGAYFANEYIDGDGFKSEPNNFLPFFIIGILVMAAAIITGAILTQHKAKQEGQTIFSKTALRMIAHIGFPMIVGFFVWLSFALNGDSEYMAGTLLIFYGLGLINGSKYTLNSIRNFGIINVIFGILAFFFPSYGMILWCNCFGTGHIAYGVTMWLKQERN